MEVMCENCGAVYTVQDHVPASLVCFCNSKEFKVAKKIV